MNIGSLDNNPNITWTPTDPADAGRVKTGDIGAVRNVEAQDGKIVLTTDYGRLELATPKLPPPSSDLNADDFKNVADSMGFLSENAVLDVTSLMTLFHQVNNQMRTAEREARLASREAQFNALQNAADKIREAAAWALAAGIVTGVTQMASGAMQMAGGIKAVSQSSGGAAASGAQGQSKVQIGAHRTNAGTAASAGAANPDATVLKWKGAGEMASGSGQIASAALNYMGEQAKADQKEYETAAQKAETMAQDANEMMQNLRDIMKDVQEKLQAINQAQNDTTRSILRNI